VTADGELWIAARGGPARPLSGDLLGAAARAGRHARLDDEMASSTRRPHRLYRLGRGTRPLASAGGFAWPCGADWDADAAQRPLWLWEGVAHGQAAANLSPAEALRPAWREHLAACDAMWLLPLLQRMADGEPVAWADVACTHAAARGAAPEPVDLDAGDA
jgi:hypothetical protein